MLLRVDQVCAGNDGEGRFLLSNEELRVMQDQFGFGYGINDCDDELVDPNEEFEAYGLQEVGCGEIGADFSEY